MKELRGAATVDVAAPLEMAFALLHDLDNYPNWYPEVVRQVEVVDRNDDGVPARAHATLHVSHGPIVRDFPLLLAVAAQPPELVRLTRIPHEPRDKEHFRVTWRLRERAGTVLELDLGASLSVPRFIPLGGIGDAIAHGFVAAAARALGV
jgi:hypothetical protein